MMRFKRWVTLAVVFATGWCALMTVQAQAPAKNGLSAELAKLQKDFSAAQAAYYAPYSKAKTDGERAKIVLDPAKNPAKVFIGRAKALAAKAKGTDSGAPALMFLQQLCMDTGDTVGSKASMMAVIDDYPSSPSVAQLANQLSYGFPGMSLPDCRAILRKIIARSPKAKDAAQLALATTLSGPEAFADQRVEAHGLLEALQSRPDPIGKQAKSQLFLLDHLQIGMVAPDFVGKDIDGKTFNLSDYRGKVVVVDFWGFW